MGTSHVNVRFPTFLSAGTVRRSRRSGVVPVRPDTSGVGSVLGVWVSVSPSDQCDCGFRLGISPASKISAVRRSRGTRSTQAWASPGSEA